ncbi:MAG: asparaginase [Spirochaetes bacterium]|nr:asparaginase [Spirochaetota bacterium]
MSEVLTEVSRGPIVESVHYGDAVVTDSSGKIFFSIGNPGKLTYIRSAGKPLQALNVFLSGAMGKFNFSDAELAIMCASHYGEHFHTDTVEGILRKLGLNLTDLHCGSTLSIQPDFAKEQLMNRVQLQPYNNDCSGKHTGMLAACLAKSYPIEGYTEENHPVQKDILNIVAAVCGLEPSEIPLGIDGCSVPVHGLPLKNMAMAYARLANPENLPSEMMAPAEAILRAMNAHPEMVAGTGGFCTELIRAGHGKLIGKLGAEGIYCVGLRGRNLGLAIKIADGNYSRALNPAVLRCLEDLDALNREEMAELETFRTGLVRNGLGMLVGEVKPVFHLRKYE